MKAAGRSMAIEAVDAIAQHVASLTPDEMADNTRIDALTDRAADAAVNMAETYLEAGIPAPWVKAFLSTFHRTATDRLDAYALAARAANGNAGTPHAVH
ncbi:hypothetical protein [Methylobacterium sp. OAE515]|uniref:hypothetical protein n=1 Tax=Methylobacterium sp. OAE515 TaxID=2817895 RepID=UPI0035A12E78